MASICGSSNTNANHLISLFNTALDNTCAGTTNTFATTVTTSSNSATLKCLEYISHVANGIGSGTTTIEATTAAQCRTRYSCAASDMTAGDLKDTILGNNNNNAFSDHLEAEICAQFYI